MSHGSHSSFFGGLKGFLVNLVSHHSYLCGVEVYPTRTHALNLSSHKLVVFCTVAVVSRITRFLQESLHTNPFRKIPDYNSRQFTFFKQYFTKSVGPGRFSAENLKVESQTDRLTDELIWGGLSNLRFLQVYCIIS